MSDKKEETTEEVLEQDFDAAFNAVTSGSDEGIPEHDDKPVEEANEVVADDDKEVDKVEEVADGEKEDDKEPPAPPEPTEVEKLQQTIMRQAASQSALQRKLNEAKVIKPKQFAPVLDENGVFTDSFKELQKEFPEADFGRVENIITQQNDHIAQLSQNLVDMQTNIQATGAATRLKEQTAIVKLSHPDIAEVAQSEAFGKWQETLTPAELNHVKSAVDADEINSILNVFKSVTGYKSKAAQEAESTEKAEATVKKREKRSIAAQGIQTKQQASPATGASDKLDEDAIFDKVFNDVNGGS